MMREAYIVGIFSTPASNYIDVGFKELTRRAYLGALQDAGFENGDDIEFCYFSNYMSFIWGQPVLQGNNFTIPLKNEGVMSARMPIFNVEGGCSSGSIAVHGAWKDVLSGKSEVAMAIGVEKMNHPGGSAFTLDNMAKDEDTEGRAQWIQLLREAANKIDAEITFGPDRSIAMDFYALLAKEHMKKYGTTQRDIACAAAKNHQNSITNPRSQYHFNMSVDDVLNDRIVSWPLTRAMCAPIGDAAAAAIICSGDYLKRMPIPAQERAVKIRASVFSGGVFYRQHQDDRASATAANLAYLMAGVNPKDIDVVELHDATSMAEILLLEDLQLCRPGDGGRFTSSGATKIDGEVAVNASGGLIARGHPIGASGIMMLNELALQLRGEGGINQVKGARLALQENGGGIIGMDAAVCGVTILESNV
jgi:acetyl-CoA acetyltransferase